MSVERIYNGRYIRLDQEERRRGKEQPKSVLTMVSKNAWTNLISTAMFTNIDCTFTQIKDFKVVRIFLTSKRIIYKPG